MISRLMTKSPRPSETPATRWLRARGVAFTEHLYEYVERGGTRESARQLGVDERIVVKTLVMQDDEGRPLLVLMHGDREVSTRSLARQLGRRRIDPCKPEVAQRHSGYLVGGTSPFGTRREMPVYAERTIFDLPEIFLNGGGRGHLVKIDPAALRAHLGAIAVECAIDR
jgi:Cys-tRNA(Pro) deacylase